MVTASGKCCLWIIEWLNRVRVKVMVKVSVTVRVVVRVRVLLATCFAYPLNVLQICSTHFTRGQSLYGMIRAVRT